MKNIIVDAGPLIALFDKDDKDVIGYIEVLLKKKCFSQYVKEKIKEDLAKRK